MHSFVNMGYLTDSDALYRSEVDNMAEVIADMVSVPGDVDGDGTVDLLDTLTALKAMLNGETLPVADMNGDGKVSLVDILRMLKIAVG